MRPRYPLWAVLSLLGSILFISNFLPMYIYILVFPPTWTWLAWKMLGTSPKFVLGCCGVGGIIAGMIPPLHPWFSAIGTGWVIIAWLWNKFDKERRKKIAEAGSKARAIIAGMVRKVRESGPVLKPLPMPV